MSLYMAGYQSREFCSFFFSFKYAGLLWKILFSKSLCAQLLLYFLPQIECPGRNENIMETWLPLKHAPWVPGDFAFTAFGNPGKVFQPSTE